MTSSRKILLKKLKIIQNPFFTVSEIMLCKISWLNMGWVIDNVCQTLHLHWSSNQKLRCDWHVNLLLSGTKFFCFKINRKWKPSQWKTGKLVQTKKMCKCCPQERFFNLSLLEEAKMKVQDKISHIWLYNNGTITMMWEQYKWSHQRISSTDSKYETTFFNTSWQRTLGV